MLIRSTIAAPVSAVIGVTLVIAGLLVPSSTLIDYLRITPDGLRGQLIAGGVLFKIGLIIQGLFMMALRRFFLFNTGDPKANRSDNRSDGSFAFIIVALLASAFLLRVYNLNSGIWFDEIVTYVLYMERSFGEILTSYDNQNNHLLYTLFARTSFLIFGDSVWSLRFPAVLFGVGSIWALYLLSCQVATPREGLLSAGILTFSYHHVWFSQNARGYTALLFFSILSSLYLVRALRERNISLWLMYGVSTALGLMTHLTMAFVVVAHCLIFLMSALNSSKRNRRDIWWEGFFGFGCAGIVTFQLYSFVLPQLLQWQGKGVSSWQGTIAVSPWKSPIWMMGEVWENLNIGPGSGLLLLLCAIVLGAGLIDFAQKKSPVVILLIIPVITGIIVIMSLNSTLLPRLFFFSMGFAVIIIVRGLMCSGKIISWGTGLDASKGRLIGAGLCICTIIIAGVSVFKAYQPKQDYGGALKFLENQRQPGDVVLTVGLTVLPYQQFYKMDWSEVTVAADLDKDQFRGKRTWLVYTMPVVLRAAHPEIMNRIRREFEVVKEFPGTLSGGNIVVAIAKT